MEALWYSLRPWRKHQVAAPNLLPSGGLFSIPARSPQFQQTSPSLPGKTDRHHINSKNRKKKAKETFTPPLTNVFPDTGSTSRKPNIDNLKLDVHPSDNQTLVCKTHINLGPILKECKFHSLWSFYSGYKKLLFFPQ